MTRSVLNVSFFMSVALMFGRLSGMVREQVLGVRLGTGETTDAILLMLTLPDLLVGLVLSGGFSAVLVPVFRRAEHDLRVALFRRAAGLAVVVGLAAAALLAVLARPTLDVLAQSLDHRAIPGLGTAFRLSLLSIPVAAAIGAATAYLNAVGKFSVSAASVILFNLLLAGYFAFMPVPVVFSAFALCLNVAMLIRLGVQVAQMPDALRSGAGTARFADSVLRRFGMGVLATGIVVAVPVLFRSLYSAGGDGYLAQFNFAMRIYELPNAIVVAPLVAVFLPVLTDADGKCRESFNKTQFDALEIGFAVALIAASVGALNAETITRLLFGYGSVTETAVVEIARVLQILLASLPFAAIFQITSSGLNARALTYVVMRNSALALAFALGSYGVLNASGMGPWSAALGVVMFNLAAALLNLAVLLPRAVAPETVRRLAVHVARVFLVLLPFAFLSIFLEPLPLWLRMVLILAETALLLAVSSDLIRRLHRIRLA